MSAAKGELTRGNSLKKKLKAEVEIMKRDLDQLEEDSYDNDLLYNDI